MNASDTVIWSTIGHGFCSFKKKVITQNFCRNRYNISGLCSKQACPLSNSKYATVLEEEGKVYLYIKTAERCHTPSEMWERIPLHPNFLKAIEQINKHLQYWSKFMRSKAKLRMTKIHQYLIRMRRLRNRVQPELVAVNKHQEKVEAKREKKAHAAAQIQDAIRGELLERLRQGTYGELYDDIVNFNSQVYNDALDEIEDEEFEETSEFVEAYSDEEEEEDMNQEFEYEMETDNGRERERMTNGKRKTPVEEEDDMEDGYDFDDEEELSEEEVQAPAPKSSFADRARAAKKGKKYVGIAVEDSD